jgi:hypothetical protein
MKKAAWVLGVCLILSASLLLTIRMIRTSIPSGVVSAKDANGIENFATVDAPPAQDPGNSQGLQERPDFTLENGKQVITILARGGYSPKESIVKAGVSSILRMTTKNTFDCSRALILPSLGLQKILPASGAVDIAIPAQKQGTRFYGICAMGMYAFLITFK